ncbi:MAG: hypothetical protein DDT34_01842 [Firmicutes bacterium]|nr:hypothetical protein [Bacillota bacterium]
MRPRHAWLIALPNVFLSCAITVFVSFTAIQFALFQQATTVPFGLPNETFAVRVRRSGPPLQASEGAGIRRELVRLLGATDAILVWVGEDFGLAVHDPNGFFAARPLRQGGYFDRADFGSELPSVLVKYGTPLYRMIADGSVIVGGAKATVRGVYDQNHPLYTREQFYVVSFLNTTSLQATYYLSSDLHVVSGIVDLLSRHGYTAQVIPATHSVASALRGLLSPQYTMTAAGLVFLWFNCFLVYFVMFTRFGKMFSVHMHFGATKTTLRNKLVAMAWLPMGMGTLLGIVTYAVMFRLSDGLSLVSLPAWVVPTAFALSLAMSTMLLVGAFSCQKIWATEVGKL